MKSDWITDITKRKSGQKNQGRSIVIFIYTIFLCCNLLLALPTPRPPAFVNTAAIGTRPKDCRVQLLPQIEGCLLGFIQHYKIYREMGSSSGDDLRLGNLCHSYGETLQCLHLAFLKCSPADIHLNFMESKLPNPTLMQDLCFSSDDDYDDYDDNAVESIATTKSILRPVTRTTKIYNDNSQRIQNNEDSIKRVVSSTNKVTTTTSDPVFQIGNSLRVHIHDNTDSAKNKFIEQRHIEKTRNSHEKTIDKDSKMSYSRSQTKQTENEHGYSLKQSQSVSSAKMTSSIESINESTDSMTMESKDCEGDLQFVNPMCTNLQQLTNTASRTQYSTLLLNLLITILATVLVTMFPHVLSA